MSLLEKIVTVTVPSCRAAKKKAQKAKEIHEERMKALREALERAAQEQVEPRLARSG